MTVSVSDVHVSDDYISDCTMTVSVSDVHVNDDYTITARSPRRSRSIAHTTHTTTDDIHGHLPQAQFTSLQAHLIPLQAIQVLGGYGERSHRTHTEYTVDTQVMGGEKMLRSFQ